MVDVRFAIVFFLSIFLFLFFFLFLFSCRIVEKRISVWLEAKLEWIIGISLVKKVSSRSRIKWFISLLFAYNRARIVQIFELAFMQFDSIHSGLESSVS